MSAETAELACTYAALILADEKIPVTAEKLNTLIKAAGIEVPAFWASIFARVLATKNIDDLISNVGGGAAPAVAAPVAKEEAKGKKEAPKEEKKKKEEAPPAEEEDDIGLGLFD